MWAADSFTIEVRTRRGLQRFIVLFFIELSTREVEIAGIAAAANGRWMSQIGRNLTDAVDGILNGKRYLVHDCDPLFTTEFLNVLADVGVKSVKLPPQSTGLGQPTNQPRTGPSGKHRRAAAAAAPGRHADAQANRSCIGSFGMRTRLLHSPLSGLRPQSFAAPCDSAESGERSIFRTLREADPGHHP